MIYFIYLFIYLFIIYLFYICHIEYILQKEKGNKNITKIANLQARKSSKNSSKLNVIIIKWLNFVIDRVARNPNRS